MKVNYRIDFIEEMLDNTFLIDSFGAVMGMSSRAFGLLLISVLIGCNAKPKEEVKPTQFFTINGTELNTDVVGIPDSLDKDVYQAEVNKTIRFQGPPAIAPDINLWYIDGNEIVKGSGQFEHIFDLPGLYQVRHCHGLYYCATRYVYVRNPVPVVEEVPEVYEEKPIPEPVNRTPTKEPKKQRNEPRAIKQEYLMPPVPPQAEKPIEKPVEKPVNKPVGKPPENFKNSASTGLSSGSYKSDCAKWVESASIKFKPREFCLLNTAVIYGSGPGKVRITLSDGGDYSESISILLTQGRTQFAFSDLIPVLYPDRVYTLTITTISGTDDVKPKFANVSTCNVSPKTTSAMAVEYGSNSVLFDINYKVK